MSVARLLGRAGGVLLAPLTGGVAALRQARMFHPHGATFAATVSPLAASDDDRARRAGERLAGHAVARLSSAWWKRREWRDVLGIALRLRRGPLGDPRPDAGDQDLLFATIRSPWTTPLAPLSTDHRDFLANDYYGVSPFEDDDLGRVYLRLATLRGPEETGNRADRLRAAVERGRARFTLEASQHPRRGYRSVARIDLEAPLAIDQAALRFSPFRAGRGVRPVGFVHHLRRAAYAASQRLRPDDDSGRARS